MRSLYPRRPISVKLLASKPHRAVQGIQVGSPLALKLITITVQGPSWSSAMILPYANLIRTALLNIGKSIAIHAEGFPNSSC